MHEKKSLKIKQNLCGVAVVLALLSCSTKTIQAPWDGSEPITCEGDNCVAVGAYNLDLINGSAGLPLGAFSTDSGQTFSSATQFSILSDMTPGTPPTTSIELLGINCSGQHCIGVGTYDLQILAGPTLQALPFAATSNDGGKTFFANVSQPLLPIGADTSKGSELNAVTCHGQRCVAVGIHNLTLVSPGYVAMTLPLAVLSTDGGTTFTAATQPALPIGATSVKNAFLYGVSCPNAQNCVGIGTYNWDASVSPNTALPYATMSNDGGATFTQASVPVLPDDANPTASQWAELRAVTCEDKHCVAVGFYNRTNTAASPLVVISNDGGATFSKAYKPSVPTDANSNFNTQLSGISCVGKRCVAVGNYNVQLSGGNNPTAAIPFILISNDSGETFSTAYAPTLSNADPALPALLTGISCDANRCVAVGGYDLVFASSNINSGLPLALVSTNSGDSFTQTPPFALPSNADPAKGAMFGLSSQFN